ncbi:hypothetical protein U9M48_005474 [Paspalum notatum var. saurae]|uniref:Uncharacterized protein n=1 Tax=Paspalum notatum var. saurae TaxID=547442 RepID=A0AAQ3PQY9_PASNO
MDAWEATKVVFDRVRALDPDNASKIMGLLLIRDNSDKELIRLAFGPEHLLQAFVAAARAELAAKPASPPSPVLGPLQAGPTWGGGLPSPGAGGGGDHQSPFAADHQPLGGYDADAFYPEDYSDCWSPAGGHRRSFSLSDAEVAAAGAWRPCMYFARGYCKNGSSCRFLHGLPEDDAAAAAAAAEREMVVMRAKALAAARPQPLMASAFPFSPSPKGVNNLGFLLQQQQQQQQSEPQRAAAAAAAMLLGGGGGDDMHSRFPARSPRMMDRGDLMASPAARQIYLTFPADSTFSEEDVSNYFSSMYGPVQDVRIPYQQKRMFGFVTFVYADTVKIILNKGNPHFVCDARVLVKPYKEKGKVPDRFRKLQHPHHGDFAGCTSPTGLLDSRDPFDLQQPQIGALENRPRMMYGNMPSHEAFLRRKLEEQQQAAELQQAIEQEGRRFMGLQLLDLKSRGHRVGSYPMSLGQADGKGSGNGVHLEDVSIQDNKMNSGGLAMSAPAAATDAEGKHEEQQEEDGDGSGSPKQAVNPGEEEKRESGPVTATPNVACGFQESGVVEHILPDSPFASPTKASIDTHATATTAQNGSVNDSSPHHVASSLFPPTSTLELPPYNSCFYYVPRNYHDPINKWRRG